MVSSKKKKDLFLVTSRQRTSWQKQVYMKKCIHTYIYCYVYPLLFDDPDRRPDVMQMWIEVMASASNLGALQWHGTAQLWVGTDRRIWVTAANSAWTDICRIHSRVTMPKWKEIEVSNETWSLQLIMKKRQSESYNRFVNRKSVDIKEKKRTEQIS